jgi:hypothetical protein
MRQLTRMHCAYTKEQKYFEKMFVVLLACFVLFVAALLLAYGAYIGWQRRRINLPTPAYSKCAL